jgi:hypothetical protein
MEASNRGGPMTQPTPQAEPSIPTREICGLCHRVSPVGFWVPNDVWAEVVHPHYRESVHCLSCFIERADEKLVKWDRVITFRPTSLRTHIEACRESETEKAMVRYTNILNAAVVMACSNGAINRAQSEELFRRRVNEALTCFTGGNLDEIDRWIGTLNSEQVETLVDGEESEMRAVEAAGPIGTAELMRFIWDGPVSERIGRIS